MAGYSLDQALRALAAMREAAGLPEEQFGTEQFVGMISDEIDSLRQRGWDDGRIAALVQQSSGIALDEATLREHYTTPEQRHGHGPQ